MISTFHPNHNVHDWNSDDVIDWLHREKLEMYRFLLEIFFFWSSFPWNLDMKLH